MGLINSLLTIFILIIVVVLLYPYILQALSSLPSANQSGLQLTNYAQPPTYAPSNATVAYALQLINNDRNAFGVANVTVSNITSAQQHADSMLRYGYFSHWDIYGMKPYMRYTLVGGRGAVDENIGYIYRSNGINVTQTLQQIEHNFVYNDAKCCNNGHRDNILDPMHTQVSIGIAYNATTLYFVEDFINNYINWQSGTPAVTQNADVSLSGVLAPGYNISSVEIVYDTPVRNLTTAQLARSPYNSSYSFGQTVGGVGYSQNGRVFYYQNLTTINATVYSIQANRFDIRFGLSGLIHTYGAGEYTVVVWLAGSSKSSSFVGSTYTVFVNGNGQAYVPSSV